MTVLADPPAGRPDVAVVRRGELLSAVIAYEKGRFPLQPESSDPAVCLPGVYRAAVEWADEAGRAVGA